MKSKLLVSACLLGICCRYDGKHNLLSQQTLEKLKDHYELIPACPEQLGGLSTPRLPAEIQENGQVMREDGKDVNSEFVRGANEAYKIAKFSECKTALLKSNSPSCGNKKVYNGSFEGVLVAGKGVTAKLFEKKGIKVYNEEQIIKLIKE